MEIKYTSDGRKVVVIGNLNSQEKIVQEIFIVNNQEVPSGENFVAKSLHDAPAISWKEKGIKELEDRYESTKKKYESEIDRLKKDYDLKSKELRCRIEYTGAALKNVAPESFKQFVDLLTGNIKWVVVTSYTPELLSFNEFNIMYDGRLRLMSIFGKDDGSFTYAKGRYSDYSGSDEKFMPFNDYNEAFDLFKELLLKRDATDETLKVASKHNIQFPAEKIQEYKDKRTSVLNNNISKYKEEIEKWQIAINDLNKSL